MGVMGGGSWSDQQAGGQWFGGGGDRGPYGEGGGSGGRSSEGASDDGDGESGFGESECCFEPDAAGSRGDDCSAGHDTPLIG